MSLWSQNKTYDLKRRHTHHIINEKIINLTTFKYKKPVSQRYGRKWQIIPWEEIFIMLINDKVVKSRLSGKKKT